MKNKIWDAIQRVKTCSPLVHNITNYVVMNNSANALLAVGASPIMSHAVEEINEMVALCGATVINIGTLDRFSIEAMLLAVASAKQQNKPVVFDPVGVGATSFRTETATNLLHSGSIHYIRGNASEIIALSGGIGSTKGVDATESSLSCRDAAIELSRRTGAVVCVSGETDLVVLCNRVCYLHAGSKLMEKVTGLGCSATAILGAFAAVHNEDRYLGALAATALMGVAGEIAAFDSPGPGTLQLRLLDKLYNITREEFFETLKIEFEQ